MKGSVTACTCADDPRHCARHPYVFEGANGTPRTRSDLSPNKRLTVTLADRIRAAIA